MIAVFFGCDPEILSIKQDVETATMCRDMETTGTDAAIRDNQGNIYDRMSLQFFQIFSGAFLA